MRVVYESPGSKDSFSAEEVMGVCLVRCEVETVCQVILECFLAVLHGSVSTLKHASCKICEASLFAME